MDKKWVIQVNDLRLAPLASFKNGPDDKTPAQYFADSYADLIRIGYHKISTHVIEYVDTNSNRRVAFARNFDRIGGIFDRYYLFLENNYDGLVGPVTPEERWEFHRRVWESLHGLAEQPAVSLHADVQTHIQKMAVILARHAPGAAQAWVDDQCKAHSAEAFRSAFERFSKLPNRIDLHDDAGYRRLVLQSQGYLRRALRAAHLPVATMGIHDGLFSNSRRPTYIDFSCTSDQYLYGLAERPGVLSLRQKLGGKISPQQQYQITKARKIAAPEIPVVVPAKRPAPRGSAQPPARKKIRANIPGIPGIPGYSMTLADVNADIDYLYYEARIGMVRPLTESVVTMTCNPLPPYNCDGIPRFKHSIIRCNNTYYDPKFQSPSEAHREERLNKLQTGIAGLRTKIRNADVAANYMAAWSMVQAVFELKYVRSLYMKLLLSSKTPPARNQMLEALSARLDDWILFEETYIKIDDLVVEDLTKTEFFKGVAKGRITSRRSNIEQWTKLRNQLGAAMLVQPGAQEKVQEEEQEKEQEGREEEEGGGGGGGEREREGGGEEEEQAALVAAELPPQELAPGRRILYDNNYTYQLRRQSRSVYTEARLEERREARRRRFLHEPNVPWPQENHNEDERLFTLQDTMLRNVAESFQQGGPPDHEKIPKETDLDKLIYMVIMTQWRIVTARSIL
ncbi:hypothetical protein GGS26DRAFT_600133 [Hypomontagnella submonticulosa]|nr:hypothetical protein GGS26DRAFT_600133 [Hypomontagnella submonticulosa]